MKDLPEGWTTCKVSDYFHSFSGGTPDRSKSAYWGGNIPWLSSGDIKSSRIQQSSESITTVGLENSSAKLCRPGSIVIVVRSGILKHTLPIAILDCQASINQDLKCFDSGSDELNAWLAMALQAAASDILALNREGTTVQSVKYDTLKEFLLRVPPPDEQQRIVAKTSALLSKVQSSEDRLDLVPAILKRFRRAVLAAACDGRLTAQWRKLNPDRISVGELIERIRQRRLGAATTLAHKERLKEIYHATEDNDSIDLPESWRFVKLSKLCGSFDYGTSAKSQPSGKVPVLRMGNIQDGNIDWTDLVFTSDRDEIRSYSLKPRTVLFNRTNSPELVGKTAIYRGERPAIFAGYLIRINNEQELDPEYLNFCLNTAYAQEFCRSVKTDGVSQSNINAQKLGSFEVPFCPVEEQRQVVARVKKLLALADRLQARYETAKGYTNDLKRSILLKAFRGELVPTETELARREGRLYETAEQMLSRIRANQAAQNGNAQPRERKVAVKK